jgi:hypothetical protein
VRAVMVLMEYEVTVTFLLQGFERYGLSSVKLGKVDDWLNRELYISSSSDFLRY